MGNIHIIGTYSGSGGDDYRRRIYAKLDDFVSRRTNLVKQSDGGRGLYGKYDMAAKNYKR